MHRRPIANPGKLAIQAVLQPVKTQDLYFVADGTGGHVFASTLAEHLVNVQNYRKIERAERATAAALAAKQAESKAPDPAAEEPKETIAATPAAPETAEQPKEPAVELTGEELPVAGADNPVAQGEATSQTAGKIPLPRPRPVIN